MPKFWLGFLSAVGLAAVIGAVLLLGAYDVSATSGHTRLGTWVLDTTMRNSVERRGPDDAPRFSAEQVRNGFVHYRASCVPCHGAPGRLPDAWGRNMVPKPPALATAAPHWDPGELHWILRNGVKMSGMPAFGAVYDDAQLWELVAFLKQLPAMNQGQYAALERELGGPREAALETGTGTAGHPGG